MGENALGSTSYKLGMENLASVAGRFREVMHPAKNVSWPQHMIAKLSGEQPCGRPSTQNPSLNPPYYMFRV